MSNPLNINDGDSEFTRVDTLTPAHKLPPGVAADALNKRFDDGKPRPRFCVNLQPWGQLRNLAEDAVWLGEFPPAPIHLSLTPLSPVSIAIEYDSAVAGAADFLIYRSASADGPFTLVATVSGDTTYTDTGVDPDTTYYYYVIARTANGDSSPSSTESAATPANPVLAPDAPLDLAATSASASQINLAWTNETTSTDNIIVMRATSASGPFSDIATLANNATSYNNTGCSAFTTYYYKLRIVAGAEESFTNVVSATTWSNVITPNPLTGALAVAASVTPGVYRFYYVDGAIGIDGGTTGGTGSHYFTGWTVNFTNPINIGYKVSYNAGATEEFFPAHGRFTGGSGFANCVTANTNEYFEFTVITAGDVGMYMKDSIYIDNIAGSPSAQFQLRKMS